MLKHLPLKRPMPDAEGFIGELMGIEPDWHTPLVEYIVDDVVMKPIVTDLLGRRWVDAIVDRPSLEAYLDNFIAFWHAMGYDFVRFEMGLPFAEHRVVGADPAPGVNRDRAWSDSQHGTITSWADFEAYPWPRVEEFDFSWYEYLNSHLPDGMGLISCHGGGVFEHLSFILSTEGLCIALHEQPELVQAVSDKIGELMVSFYEHLLDLDRLIAVFPGDDMGFRSATIVSPNDLRKYVLPWHARFAQMTHDRGLPYFLHSCGNVGAIMPDLIDTVKIDGKHSYEDAIIPAPEFQERYGDRIAVLGGLDLNILSAGTPEQVRARTRTLVETCGPRGRYAIGSGNSVPSYVPVENYLAMVDEAIDLMDRF
jgi:uroporphyrinogen decarboxylase